MTSSGNKLRSTLRPLKLTSVRTGLPSMSGSSSATTPDFAASIHPSTIQSPGKTISLRGKRSGKTISLNCVRFFHQPRLNRMWPHKFQTGFDAGAVQAERFSSERSSSCQFVLSSLENLNSETTHPIVSKHHAHLGWAVDTTVAPGGEPKIQFVSRERDGCIAVGNPVLIVIWCQADEV